MNLSKKTGDLEEPSHQLWVSYQNLRRVVGHGDSVLQRGVYRLGALLRADLALQMKLQSFLCLEIWQSLFGIICKKLNLSSAPRLKSRSLNAPVLPMFVGSLAQGRGEVAGKQVHSRFSKAFHKHERVRRNTLLSQGEL